MVYNIVVYFRDAINTGSRDKYLRDRDNIGLGPSSGPFNSKSIFFIWYVHACMNSYFCVLKKGESNEEEDVCR